MEQKHETCPKTIKQWWNETHILPSELSKWMSPRTHSSACTENKNIRKKYKRKQKYKEINIIKWWWWDMPYVSIGVLEVKNPPTSAGDVSDMGSIPGSGRSSGGGYSNPLQYSCLENLMDRGAWWATIHRVTQSQTQLKWLSTAQQTTFCSFSLHCGEKAMTTHSSTLAWRIPWTEEPGRLQSMGSQSLTWLSNFTFTFHFPVLEKEMAIHSSVLAWRIPGTGEPGGLLSMGSHRARHNWSDSRIT